MQKLKPITAIVLASCVAGFLAATHAAEPSLRDYLLEMPMTEKLGGDGTLVDTSAAAFSFQMANSPASHNRPFAFGNRLFNTNWVEAPASVKSFDGLGPLFNRVSCSGCHTKDGRGSPPVDGKGPMDSLLMRISVAGLDAHGGPAPVRNYGGQISERANSGVSPEATLNITYTETSGHYADGESVSLREPHYTLDSVGYGPLPANLLTSPRVGTQMIGLGLLEAVPEATLLTLSDTDDKDTDGISGRPNYVWDKLSQTKSIGRFGWKANQPNLQQQNSDAALGDIGLSTPINTKQNCEDVQTECKAAIIGGAPEVSDEFIKKLTLYTQTLAVPAQRGSSDPQVVAGAKIFRDIGCASCHMPTLKTAAAANLPELENQTIHPFTDLLLHDMGPKLADGRPDFVASGNEWRTAPLWGLGLVPTVNGHNTLLHDGRARGSAEAILWHGGEAEKAMENFRMSAKDVREKLIAFLSSL